MAMLKVSLGALVLLLGWGFVGLAAASIYVAAVTQRSRQQSSLVRAIDRDLEGRDTLFGTVSRNLGEEERAMQDGLAPGQVRPGLRLLARVIETMNGVLGLESPA